MEATIPETRPPPKQQDREGRNRVPGYDVLSYACDRHIATADTARENAYETWEKDLRSHRGRIRDMAVIIPGQLSGRRITWCCAPVALATPLGCRVTTRVRDHHPRRH